MKIAICMSGQARTWRTAKDNILSYFNIREKDVQIDYFIHTWDINQYRRKEDINWIQRTNIKILPTEKDELISAFNPIDIEIEEYKEGEHVTLWASLLYSFMKSVWLKRKYEIENDFKYDIVVKARLDVNYPIIGRCNLNLPLKKFHIHPIQNLTGYSTIPMISRFPTEFNYPCFDDVFFYANSPTMDIISNCYRWYTSIVNKNAKMHTNCEYIQNSAYWSGPGTLLYKYLIENSIHPQGYRFIPYYIVRKEVEEYKLHSINNWDDIRDFSKEWYDSVINKQNSISVLEKYKKIE
jgi:hypothetical protein